MTTPIGIGGRVVIVKLAASRGDVTDARCKDRRSACWNTNKNLATTLNCVVMEARRNLPACPVI